MLSKAKKILIIDFDLENNNLYSVFCCSQEAIKYMLNRKSGCIINISSIYGTSGGSCDVHYSASKAGIDGLTKALAKEFRVIQYTS